MYKTLSSLFFTFITIFSIATYASYEPDKAAPLIHKIRPVVENLITKSKRLEGMLHVNSAASAQIKTVKQQTLVFTRINDILMNYSSMPHKAVADSRLFKNKTLIDRFINELTDGGSPRVLKDKLYELEFSIAQEYVSIEQDLLTIVSFLKWDGSK